NQSQGRRSRVCNSVSLFQFQFQFQILLFKLKLKVIIIASNPTDIDGNLLNMASLRNEPYQLTNVFTPREYQVELLDKARKQNVIVCLGTGTGKTFIAVMLIKELSHDIRESFVKNGKRTFFLVNNVPLVTQQASVISDHTDLEVGKYVGDMLVDMWDKATWQEQLTDKQVLVMTTQIFLDILCHGFLPLSKCNLVIFDECHHAIKRHPMREVMKIFDECPKEDRPHILGLTASIIQSNCKPHRLLQEITSLERTMHCTAETASDIVNVSRFGAMPDEVLVEYESYENVSVKNLLLDLNKTMEFIQSFYFSREEYEDEDLPDPIKIPKSILSELCFTLSTLGTWCTLKLSQLFLQDISKTLDNLPFATQRDLLMVAETRIRLVEKLCYLMIQDDGSCEKLQEHSSPKLLRLLEILKHFFPSDKINDSSENVEKSPESYRNYGCGIVFVQRRYTALAINIYLKEIVARDKEHSSINATYITGHAASGLKSNVSSMAHQKQEDVLKKFRQHEKNVLLATSVVEEGLDLPKCNVVVRFDLPANFRSYVQSKGRARAAGSSYVMLVESIGKNDFFKQLEAFILIEKILLGQCKDQTMPGDEKITNSFADEILPPYIPEPGVGKPRVTMSSAISLVNRYCAKLPSDTFTRLTAKCKTKEVKSDDPDKMYQCSLYLPINSPVKEIVTGKPMPGMKLAKMAVALKTCEILHKYGELDDNLLPLGKESIKQNEISSEDEDDDDDDDRKGTTKRRRYFCKQVAEPLKHSFPIPDHDCHLYVIEMKLVCPIPEEQNTRGRSIYDPADSPRCFAMLTKKPVPTICGYSVFTRSGEVSVSLKEYHKSEFRFDVEELQKLTFFHCYTFSNVLRLKKYPMEFKNDLTNSSFLIIPVLCQNREFVNIDWVFVDTIYSEKGKVLRKPGRNETTGYEFDEDKYVDAVVMPCYRNLDRPQCFYVAKICYDLKPSSEFPGEDFKTFQEYYEKKYNVTITCADQPLLDVDHTSARLNLLTPRYVNRKGVALPTSSEETKKAKRENIEQKQIFVPELCFIHPFPASLWKKTVCLPSILYRINSLLLADQLRLIVAKDIGIGSTSRSIQWPDLDFGWNLADAFKENGVDARESVQASGKIDCENYKSRLPQEISSDVTAVEGLANDNVDEVDFQIDYNSGSESGEICSIDETMNDENVDEVDFNIDCNSGSKSGEICSIDETMNDENVDEVDFNIDCNSGSESGEICSIDENVDQVDFAHPSVYSVSDGVSSHSWSNDASSMDYLGSSPSSPTLPSGGCNGLVNPKSFSGDYDEEEDIDDLLLCCNNVEILESSSVFQHILSDFSGDGNFVKDQVPNLPSTSNQNSHIIDTSKFSSSSGSLNSCSLASNLANDTVLPSLGHGNVADAPNSSNVDVKTEKMPLDMPLVNLTDEDSVCTSGGVLSDVDDCEAENIDVKDNTLFVDACHDVKYIKLSDPVVVRHRQMDTISEPIFYEKHKRNNPIRVKKSNGRKIDEVESEQVNGAKSDIQELLMSSVQRPNTAKSNSINSAPPSTVQFGDLLHDRDSLSNSLRLDTSCSFSFDEQVDLRTHPGPSPSILLQALTMSNANDGINLERLETIGDSFLKYAISVYLYCMYASVHEGKLSYLRSKQVSNVNLFKL
ncbi:DICER1 (predicted), partial [Pycnogonum litorale]